jgi:hypothetical protein
MQAHLGTFLQSWQDDADGRCLPRHVTAELRDFLTCGIAQHGFAHLHCDACHARHVVPFSCKGRAFCPSCGGRRMNEGAANLVDHVLPSGVAIRQWVLTLPFALRFPLAFDARLLGAVHRLFTDTVGASYRMRAAATCGTSDTLCGGLTVIQRASSDLRCNPHFHTLFLDGVYRPDERGGPPTFHATPPPSQADVAAVVLRASKRIVRFLQKRGLIALATAPGDSEVSVIVGDETLGEDDPLLAQLLAAATAGLPPAGPAQKRAPVRLLLPEAASPTPKGRLCAEHWGFNLHAATRGHGNDKQGKEHLCRYILRPPLANDRLHLLPGNKVELAFKRPWSDGTAAIVLHALALIARLAAIVPPPRRHTTRYFGVLSSHSALRPLIVPTAVPAEQQQAPAAPHAEPATADTAKAPAPKPTRTSKYIPWRELLRRTFGIDLRCLRCHGDLRLIALVKEEATIAKILGAMGLHTMPPLLASARAPPHQKELAWGI